MKKSEIKAALDALKEIKIAKFEDKDVRNTLIDDHFALLDAGKKVDAQIEAKRTVFLDSYKDEEQAVQELQNKMNEASTREEQVELAKQMREEHKDYLDAVKDFNESVSELYNEEVEITQIDKDKLMDELKKQDLKLSWVEALYPIFKFWLFQEKR